jgi:hypothetical protein
VTECEQDSDFSLRFIFQGEEGWEEGLGI